MTIGQYDAEEVLTITVEQAGKRLGIGRSGAYAAAARGQLPTIQFGRRLVVPLAALNKLLECGSNRGDGVEK